LFGDADSTVNRKVRAALDGGLAPIMCLGENLAQNEAGQTLEVVARQVRAGLDGVQPTERLVIAYEPIWAIGTGRPATAEGANEVIGAIRRVLADLWSGPAAGAVRI